MEIICFRCRGSKQENEFGVDNKSRSGRRATCKECENGKTAVVKEEKEFFDYKKSGVVMAPSFAEPHKVFYIFRSAFEQVTITVLYDGRYRSSHPLDQYERKHIDEKYNFKQKF